MYRKLWVCRHTAQQFNAEGIVDSSASLNPSSPVGAIPSKPTAQARLSVTVRGQHDNSNSVLAAANTVAKDTTCRFQSCSTFGVPTYFDL